MAKEKGRQILARDVLINFYKFKPFRDPNGVRQGVIVFNKSDIGYARYNAATVAVCKAFNRLINRGLALKIHGGIRLK